MAPVTQYVFAEMLVISEHFAAGSHEWLPYSVIPAFSKQIGKHQFIGPGYLDAVRIFSRVTRLFSSFRALRYGLKATFSSP